MANFNTGTTGSATNITQATAFTFTIPAGVLTGDVMIVVVSNFTHTSGSPGHSTPTSGGGSWAQIGTLQNTGALSGLNEYSTCWYKVATGADPSSTFSMTFSGTQGSTNQFWWSACLGSYTGFYTSAPVGAFAANTANNVGTPFIGPAAVTQRAGSWQVQMIAAAVSGSGSINSEPATNRELSNPGAGIDSSLSDSNASVGGAGTSIGSGSWGFNKTSGNQPIGWVVELATVGPTGGGSSLLIPPGLQSPMVLGLPTMPATAAPPVPPPVSVPGTASLIPPGLQSPMVLAEPLYPSQPAPPQQTPAPAPQPVPPGLQSPMSLAVPARPATQAPPQPPEGTPAPQPVPPGLLSPMSLAVPARFSIPPPPQQQPAPSPQLIPPGLLSPMSLGVPTRPATQAPPPPTILAQPGFYALTPPGRLSPMSIGLGLYAPSPGPGIPPIVPVVAVVRAALAADYDGKSWWKKKWILRL